MDVLAGPFRVDQGKDLAHRLLQNAPGHAANAPRLSNPPVEALDLIGKNRPLDTETFRKEHLEGITLHL